MHPVHQVILLFASLAVAQGGIGGIPQCATSCLLNAIQTDGCSGVQDFACHCQKPELVAKAVPCVASACTPPEQSAVSRAVVSLCSSVGHPITIPNPGASTTSTQATVPKATPTGSMTIPTGSSHQTSTHKYSSHAASSSYPHSSSTPRASSSGGTSGASSSAAQPPKTTSGSASPPLKTNAASQVTGGLAGVAIAAMAAFFHL
ncbi:hypothetical protein BDV28DRAFT_127131 [Aspergillus coremiiformis]|uniref:CFEM domain-containing protein n=1 Tax=Aspergillus coremiiformis TaxID=138285 RepID=A0A5N6ZHD5_9EURO|nr:hypothetical protein BDV28DRAFT_127131 [Aspergillus coremiiformis]